MVKTLSRCNRGERRAHAGFTLVGLLLILGALGLLVGVVSQFMVNSKAIQKLFSVQQLYREIDSQMINFISTRFNAAMKSKAGGCPTPAEIFGSSNFLQLASTSASFSNFKTMSGDLDAAKTRCLSPYAPSDPNSASANFFEFCLQPVAGLNLSVGGVAIDPTAGKVIEVQMQLYDVGTRAPISCKDYYNRQSYGTSDQSAGAYLWTTIYWEAKIGDVYHLQTRSLKFMFSTQ